MLSIIIDTRQRYLAGEVIMKHLYITLLITFVWIGLYAQWSTDAAAPNLIDNTMAAQVMPKTAITPDGNTYMAWIDNSTGGYRVYLQRLTVSGATQWTTALLVSSHPQMTWLTEWDITSDNDGNAILAFQDIRNVTNNVYVYKVSPTGVFLWGADGIAMSSDTDANNSNMAPTLTCTTENNVIVAWQRMTTTTTVQYQAINPAGTVLWSDGGISLTITGSRTTWPQLIPSLNGDVIMKYYVDSGPNWAPTRHIRAKRVNSAGVDVWTADAIIQSLGSISAWTQWLSLDSDGAGGMLIAWHEDRDANDISDAYVQHVNADGTLAFAANGVHVTTEMNYHQFYPKTAFDPATQETYIFWNRENGNQDQWGLRMQKLNSTGAAQWGATGMAFVNLGAFPTFPIAAHQLQSGVAFLYVISPSSGNDQVANIKAFCVNPSGQPVWDTPNLDIALTNTNKLHFDSCFSGSEFGVVTWEDGSTASSHTYAMKFNGDGSLGNVIITPYNLTATVVGADDVQLSWLFPEVLIPPSGYKVYANGTMLHQIEGAASEYLVTNLAEGAWTFHVTALWANGDETPPSNAVTVQIILNFPAPSLDWHPGTEPGTATFLWTLPQTTLPLLGFRFYDQETSQLLFAVNDSTVRTITVPWIQTAFTMYMTAVYIGEHESAPSNWVMLEVAADDHTVTPAECVLSAYPNPFSNTVNLAFNAGKTPQTTAITLYNLKGQIVRRITLDKSTDRLTWDGRDNLNQLCSPGIYFARYTTGNQLKTLKLLRY